MSSNRDYYGLQHGSPTRQPVQPYRTKPDTDHLKKTLTWLAAAFGISALATFFLGPMVPESWVMPINIGLIAVLIIASFARAAERIAPVLTLLVPTGIGIMLYHIVTSYVAAGLGDLVIASLASTGVIFFVTAAIAWASPKSLENISGPLFGITLGIIGLSLLNVFLLQVPWVSLLVGIAVVVVFTLYTFIDIQRVRDGRGSPAFLALSIFLDIVNLFLGLLRIFSFFSR